MGNSLPIAAKNGDLEEVRSLLRNGVDVDARDEKGWTAVLWASSQGHKQIVEALAANGANLNIQDGRGKTAVDYARQKGFGAALEAATARYRANGPQIVAVGFSSSDELGPAFSSRTEEDALPSQVGNGLQRQLSASSSTIHSRVSGTERKRLVREALIAVKEACDLDLISVLEKNLLKSEMCQGFHCQCFLSIFCLYSCINCLNPNLNPFITRQGV